LRHWSISALCCCVAFIGGCAQRVTHHYAPVVDGWRDVGRVGGWYTVQPKDTIYSIAWSYGLDYKALMRRNHLSSTTIQVGQRLAVSTKNGTPSHQRVILNTHQKTPSMSVPHSVSGWSWPVHGAIKRRFDLSKHQKGIDILGYKGKPIRASAAGVVVYGGSGLRGYGQMLIIKHSRAYLSAYAYNSQLLVHEGQSVRRGQVIAHMGQKPGGNRSMLHFEVRRYGKPVNPITVLKGKE
jgi:lipoprotein NlpD